MIVYTKGRDAVYIYAVEAIIFDFYGKHQIHEVNCCSACTSRFFLLTVVTKVSVVDSD